MLVAYFGGIKSLTLSWCVRGINTPHVVVIRMLCLLLHPACACRKYRYPVGIPGHGELLAEILELAVIETKAMSQSQNLRYIII